MKEMIISSLNDELLDETAKFISSVQNNDESFVAWLGFTPEEIKSQLLTLTLPFRESCVVALKEGVVCGFLGIYISEQQQILRVLGPFISENPEWHEIACVMLNALNERIPKHLHMAKVAFYGKNTHCEKLFESNHFFRYNAEKTLVFNRNGANKLGKLDKYGSSEISTRGYDAKDYDRFLQLHPEGAYFTAPEVIRRLNTHNHLIMAEMDGLMVGYVYFEMLPADKYTEICFLNVSPDFRSKGIGSVLLHEAINEAVRQDWVNNIQISVRVENKGAENLYKRIGFTEKNTVLALQRNLDDYPWGDFA